VLEMARIPTFILAVVMASALVIGLGHDTSSGGHGVQISAAPQPIEGTEPTVTVVGEGAASVNPDVAWLNIGVETSGLTASETAQENQGKMDQVMASLQSLGMTDQDIQTATYNINPDYSSEQGQPDQITGYRVTNTVRVTVRNLDQVGQVLDAVTQAGANNIYGITFGIQDQAAPQAEARAKAVADAQSRAGDLARLTGYQLGGLLSISQDVGGSPAPLANTAGVAPIQPGQLELHSQVQVTYALR
jgi:uncharacterized protein YggE